MKNTFLFALSLALLPLPAQAAPKSTTPATLALSLINHEAGDSWAEGGSVQRLDFTFLRCELEASRCELTYSVKLYDKPARVGTCSLADITGYDDLIEVVKYGFVLKNTVTPKSTPA